jgi:hypothetical protein
MKEKNTSKLEAVRAVKGAFDKFEKENLNPGNEMSSANYATALRPLVKQRTDSIEQFKAAGNEELTNKEQAELDVINEYLTKVQPQQFGKEKIETIVKQYATDNSLGKSDMGKVMSFFKTQYDGQYDGKELSLIVKSILA